MDVYIYSYNNWIREKLTILFVSFPLLFWFEQSVADMNDTKKKNLVSTYKHTNSRTNCDKQCTF